MHDVTIVETAQHMDDGIALTNIAQELVAQTFTLTGPFHQSCNIDNVAHRRHNPARMHQLRQFCQSLVRHTHLTQLRVNRTKRKIRCLCLRTRQAIKKC